MMSGMSAESSLDGAATRLVANAPAVSALKDDPPWARSMGSDVGSGQSSALNPDVTSSQSSDPDTYEHSGADSTLVVTAAHGGIGIRVASGIWKMVGAHAGNGKRTTWTEGASTITAVTEAVGHMLTAPTTGAEATAPGADAEARAGWSELRSNTDSRQATNAVSGPEGSAALEH